MMGKSPSVETQLKSAKSELRKLSSENSQYRKDVDLLRRKVADLIHEKNEWQHRFDKLLARTPQVK